MKKTIMSLIILVIVLTTISFAETNEKAKVNVTAIRIRESASTDSKIITNVYQDDEVEILEEDGEWSKIKYGEKSGYTKTEFLTKINSTSKSDSQPKETKSDYTETKTTDNQPEVTENQDLNKQSNDNTSEETTNANQLNTDIEQTAIQGVNIGENIILIGNVKIRRIPNFSTPENSEISKESNVLIENVIGNWCKISDGNNSGWILKNKLFNGQSTETPTIQEDTDEQTDNQTIENTESTENTTSDNTITDNATAESATQTNTTSQENTENKSAIVIVETARVRQSASSKGEIIGTLDEDEVVKITGEEGDFYKISTNSIDTGYVSKRLVKEKNVSSRSSNIERTADIEIQDTVTDEANTQLTEIFSQENEVIEEQNTNASIKNEVIEFAKQYLGYPYVSGGSSPQTGFDCSGFTRYIFGHFGYTLGSTAASQTSLGEVVERENLQTADLILFYDEGMTKIGHVGIFLGDGNFIHSANPKRGVVIDNLNTNSYYTKRFVTARRIVE